MQGSRNISNEDGSILVFRKLEESLEKNRLKFVKQNSALCDAFERIIGFQHVIHAKISAKHEKHKDDWAHRGTPDEILTEVFVLGLLHKNTQYLVSARHVLAQRTLHASGSLVRPVVESIPKSFYLMARSQTIKKFMLVELYPTWKAKHPISDQPIKAFLEFPETRKILNGQATEKEFNKFCKNYNGTRIRKEIYDGKTLELQNQLYAALSSSSHPSLFRTFTPEHSPKLSRNFMQIITDLSFLNLFLTINSQRRLLDERRFAESREFMRKIWKDVGPLSRFAHMYPSKDEYRNNLAITIESLS